MIQPPGRIEQLNNFKDSLQSPDGLDRLRAFQQLEQALPSTKAQGLMGMPQVTVPQMQPQGPMMNREDGGPIINKFGGGFFKKMIESDDVKKLLSPTVATPQVVEEPIPVSVPENTMKVFARDQEGIRNRAIQGGVLEGQSYIPPVTVPVSENPMKVFARDEEGIRNRAIQGGVLEGQSYPTAGGGTTTAVLPEDYQTIPQTQFTFEGNQPQVQPSLTLSTPMQGQFKSKASAMAHASANQGGLVNVYQLGDGSWDYQRTGRSQNTFYGGGMAMKGGGQVIPRQYGGEIGTGGLIGLTDSGMQIFDNSQEGALNRATHGGVLEGYNYTPSTGGTATATSVPDDFQPMPTTDEPVIQLNDPMDAPGTLAAGGASSSYGNTLPKSAIADTALYNLPSVQAKGGVYNAGDVRDSGMSLDRPAGAPETIVQPQTQTPYRDPYTGKIPYDLWHAPVVNDFGQGYDLKDMDYFTANALALKEGATRFIYNDEYARVDPGLLSTYDYSNLGTKPYNYMDDSPYNQPNVAMDARHMGIQANPSSASAMRAKGYYPGGFSGGDWTKDPPPGSSAPYPVVPHFRSGIDIGGPYGITTQIQASGKRPEGYYMRREGGQVDPAQSAQGLASFGRHGDNILVHMNPEELSGLTSLGKITYNPITGLPEAFNLGKMLRKLAPIALAIAAPYAFGATTALGIGASTAFGSFMGNMIAGAKPGDALKAGLFSGLTAGVGSYFGGAASGFGGAAGQAGSQAAGQAIGQTVGPGAMGAGGFGTAATQSAGTSLLGGGLSTMPTSMGAGGFGQAVGAGGTLAAPIASEFTNVANIAGRPSYGGTVQQQLRLAPKANLPYGGDPAIGNPMVPGGRDIAPVQQNLYRNARIDNAGQVIAGPEGAYSEMTPAAGEVPGTGTYGRPEVQSIFKDQTPSNINRMVDEFKTDYGTWKGAAKIVGMDLATPDWEEQYAAEAAAKNQQLTDAGYTVETGFDGQTVIRDSSGVVMPRNLTPQMILDRALGKAPRTTMVPDYRYGPSKAEGGLISLKHGGEFSGMVSGDGHGMSDNVYMPIVEKGHGSQVGTLAVSPSEYVVDSYTMAALGNGNADAGAKVMDNVVKGVRKKAYGNMRQPNEINGLSALQPMMERANI